MNITLIGMAGTGKSTIGKQLAQHLNYTFIDHDEIIEKNHHCTLQHLINQVGEQAFLQIEEDTVLQMGDIKDTISTPGGSIIYCPKAMDYLKNSSTLIYLDTPFQVIQQRINPQDRGIIGLKNKTLKSVYEERHHLYKKYAHIQIPCPQNTTIQKTVNTIIEKLTKFPLRRGIKGDVR
jgi:shikimate kinase